MPVFKGKWIKIDQKGVGPGARSSHAVAVVGDKLYAFGGEHAPRVPVDNALHVFDFQTSTWTVASDTTGDVPPPRVGVTMASVGPTLYVFGGRDASHAELNELYSFDTASSAWSLLSSGPPHRSYHSMAASADAVFVFGGCGVGGRRNDLWEFNIGTNSWVQHAASPSPENAACPRARGGPGLAVVKGKVVVVYGFGGEDELEDVHLYDLGRGEWVEVDQRGERPSGRSVFSTAVIGGYVVVFGGEVDPSDQGHLGAGKFSADVYVLDVERGEWGRCEDGRLDGEHPGPRGWCAFGNGRLDGREGLVVYGGNSPSNDRLDDMWFFTLDLDS
ncbi:hypothetical protein Sjap_003822 [Stephania japonica]|uniref:Nitrile-specifier protein 5 n=1 Tax=Stephania japonica TaxID=461633 RepID=A0AAP0KPI7_9MAGN